MFQLRIRGDAKEMKGQWIGFSSSSGRNQKRQLAVAAQRLIGAESRQGR